MWQDASTSNMWQDASTFCVSQKHALFWEHIFLERIFQLVQDEKLSEEVRNRLRIGVHWDTDPRLL